MLQVTLYMCTLDVHFVNVCGMPQLLLLMFNTVMTREHALTVVSANSNAGHVYTLLGNKQQSVGPGNT